MPELPSEGCQGLGTEKRDRGRPLQANADHEAVFQHVLSGKMSTEQWISAARQNGT